MVFMGVPLDRLGRAGPPFTRCIMRAISAARAIVRLRGEQGQFETRLPATVGHAASRGALHRVEHSAARSLARRLQPRGR
jgi:hypothetical protein